MNFLAFPLRLEGAFLERTGEPEAVLQLIGLMARTPSGSWPGCRTFGVRDLFEGMRLRPERLASVTETINATLTDLGITNFRLSAITREAAEHADVDVYTLTLVDTSDAGRKYTTVVGGRS
ncbi:MAG: hypothetical protein K2X03_29180 [Bryobacteraceae bacterium]|nr:hypothetical protein [Bryobacteraceae bacterium]